VRIRKGTVLTVPKNGELNDWYLSAEGHRVAAAGRHLSKIQFPLRTKRLSFARSGCASACAYGSKEGIIFRLICGTVETVHGQPGQVP
jgi:hypothetical protein